MLSTLGPDFGYFSNSKERWIIAEPNKKDSVKEIFKETVINIAVKAKIHLVAAISSREYQEDNICTKASDWVSEAVQLEKFAQTRSTGMLCCFHLRQRSDNGEKEFDSEILDFINF